MERCTWPASRPGCWAAGRCALNRSGHAAVQCSLAQHLGSSPTHLSSHLHPPTLHPPAAGGPAVPRLPRHQDGVHPGSLLQVRLSLGRRAGQGLRAGAVGARPEGRPALPCLPPASMARITPSLALAHRPHPPLPPAGAPSLRTTPPPSPRWWLTSGRRACSRGRRAATRARSGKRLRQKSSAARRCGGRAGAAATAAACARVGALLCGVAAAHAAGCCLPSDLPAARAWPPRNRRRRARRSVRLSSSPPRSQRRSRWQLPSARSWRRSSGRQAPPRGGERMAGVRRVQGRCSWLACRVLQAGVARSSCAPAGQRAFARLPALPCLRCSEKDLRTQLKGKQGELDRLRKQVGGSGGAAGLHSELARRALPLRDRLRWAPHWPARPAPPPAHPRCVGAPPPPGCPQPDPRKREPKLRQEMVAAQAKAVQKVRRRRGR